MEKGSFDRPITEPKEDKFHRLPLVKSIAEDIKKAGVGFNFLLSGEWGSGKTSILNLLEKELSKELSIKVIKFNPWKYLQTKEKASVSRKLLIEVRKALGDRNPEARLYEGTTFETVTWSRVMPVIFSNLLLSLIWFSVVSALIFLISWLVKNYSDPSFNIISFYKEKIFIPIIAALIPMVSATIASIKTKPSIAESIEQFEELFRKTVERTPFQKIVIFIDDLDRCSKSDIQQVLTSLFTVFEHKKCFYIVAADFRVIEPAAGASAAVGIEEPKDLKDLIKTGKEYLKKIFQFIYTIPPLPLEKVNEEVERELKKYG